MKESENLEDRGTDGNISEMDLEKGSELYSCTVHSVLYLINTPTNEHIFI